jgi:hypothetical protein
VLKREKGTKTTQQNKGVKKSTIRVPLCRAWPLLKQEEARREGIYTRMVVTCGACRR